MESVHADYQAKDWLGLSEYDRHVHLGIKQCGRRLDSAFLFVFVGLLRMHG